MMTTQRAIAAFKRATGIEPVTVRAGDWTYARGTGSGFESFRGLCEPGDVLDAIREQRQYNQTSWFKTKTDFQLSKTN